MGFFPSVLRCRHALRLSKPNTGIPSRSERTLSLHTHCKHDERSNTPHCWIVDQPLALARRVGPDSPLTFMDDVHVILRLGNGPWQAFDRLAPQVASCCFSFSRPPGKRNQSGRCSSVPHVLWFSKVSSGICWLNVELHNDKLRPHKGHHGMRTGLPIEMKEVHHETDADQCHTGRRTPLGHC